MKPMDSLKKPAMMVRLRNRKGFSLIEMAIVLVIIGIIIAAIIKGQDLISNSQAKKVISATTQWRNLTMAFYDRNGRFPGDGSNKNGIIGDTVALEQVIATTAIGELATIMEQAPENPLVLGSTSFWMYIGATTTTDSGARNAIFICANAACTGTFSADQLEMIKAVDTAIDGVADGGAGAFRAVTTPPTLPALSVGTVNNRATASVTAASIAVVPTTASGVAPWTAGTNTAAVWLFDKNF